MHVRMHVHAGCSRDYSFTPYGHPKRQTYLMPFRLRLPPFEPSIPPYRADNLARSFIDKGELPMRRGVRTGAVIATGILTAVALTGCSSDSEKSDDRGSGSGAGRTTPAPGGDDGGSGTDAAALEGGWAGRTNGKAVVLSVSAGKAVLVTEQHACTGTVQGSGKVTLTLKCVDGGDDRSTGAVESNDGKTVVVSWDSGVTDTLAKTDPGALPSGLPDLEGLPTP
jgi:hypothetical protein